MSYLDVEIQTFSYAKGLVNREFMVGNKGELIYNSQKHLHSTISIIVLIR